MRPHRLLLVLVLAGCVTARVEAPRPVVGPPPPVEPPKVEPPSPYHRPDITALREEAQSLLRQQSDLYWRSWAFGEPVDVGATFKGHDTLFAPGTVKLLQAARQEASGEERQALQAFELYVAGEVIARSTEASADAVSTLMAEATLSTPGAPRFARLEELLAGEASADQRAKLQTASVAVLNRLWPLVEARNKAIDTTVKELGYPSSQEFGARLRGLTLEQLERIADSTLTTTQELYAKAMEKAAIDELALPLARVRRRDLPRILRRQGTDAAFPWTKVLPAAQGMFSGIGFDLTKEPGLRLDIGPFEKKQAHAICIPVDVPGDVRVSVKPHAGVETLRETSFAFAEGLAATRNRRPEWEFQFLGGRPRSEAIAAAFQDIASTPAWLKDQTDVPEPLRLTLARRHAVERLYLVRRAAGLVLFTAQAGQGKLTEAPQLAYQRILSRAYGFALSADDAKRLALDDDPFLDNADYLLGWILAAQVAKHLTLAHGEKWWTSASAGKDLASLWARGTAVSPQDVAAWAGAAAIDPTPLVEIFGAVPGVK